MDKGASVPDRAGGADAPEPRAASQPEALIPSAEAGSIWRCAVADAIAHIDKHLTHPLKNSRRKADREFGERLDRQLYHLFRFSRGESPESYREAFRVGKQMIASSPSGETPNA